MMRALYINFHYLIIGENQMRRGRSIRIRSIRTRNLSSKRRGGGKRPIRLFTPKDLNELYLKRDAIKYELESLKEMTTSILWLISKNTWKDWSTEQKVDEMKKLNSSIRRIAETEKQLASINSQITALEKDTTSHILSVS